MAVEGNDVHVMGALACSSSADAAIAALAKRQHGVIARHQLTALGLGRGAIRHRAECGRLHRLYRGVYGVGHVALAPRGRLMAAVLAAGPGAVVSHRSAAALWGIAGGGSPYDLLVPSRRRSPAGRVTRTAALPADEQTVFDGIPLTTVPRTLLDLAAVLSPQRLERAVNEAEVQRLSDPLSLDDLVARYPRRRGTAAVRAILAQGRLGLDVTKSELELEFHAFLREHRLPRPEWQAELAASGRTFEVDCLWRAQRLAVELDSRTFHDAPTRFESDRARDRALSVAGWRVIRITWRQLHRERATLAADLRRLLG